MKTGKFLVGVLASVGAGAILGVLFAPDKGSATRKKVAQTGSDTLEDLKANLEKLSDEVTEKLKAKEDKAKEAVEKEKNKVEKVSADGKAALEN